MKKLLLIGLVSAVLAGCATNLTQEQIAAADYGNYPANYQNIVKSYYEEVAKDPDSLKYKEIAKPVRVWIKDFGTYKFGYLTCVTLNGKNSYGAYTGYKTQALLIKDDVVIHNIQDVITHNSMRNTTFCSKK